MYTVSTYVGNRLHMLYIPNTSGAERVAYARRRRRLFFALNCSLKPGTSRSTHDTHLRRVTIRDAQQSDVYKQKVQNEILYHRLSEEPFDGVQADQPHVATRAAHLWGEDAAGGSVARSAGRECKGTADQVRSLLPRPLSCAGAVGVDDDNEMHIRSGQGCTTPSYSDKPRECGLNCKDDGVEETFANMRLSSSGHVNRKEIFTLDDALRRMQDINEEERGEVALEAQEEAQKCDGPQEGKRGKGQNYSTRRRPTSVRSLTWADQCPGYWIEGHDEDSRAGQRVAAFSLAPIATAYCRAHDGLGENTRLEFLQVTVKDSEEGEKAKGTESGFGFARAKEESPDQWPEQRPREVPPGPTAPP